MSDCGVDCAERTACPIVGEPGHWQCGRCSGCGQPVHHTMCVTHCTRPVKVGDRVVLTEQTVAFPPVGSQGVVIDVWSPPADGDPTLMPPLWEKGEVRPWVTVRWDAGSSATFTRWDGTHARVLP